MSKTVIDIEIVRKVYRSLGLVSNSSNSVAIGALYEIAEGVDVEKALDDANEELSSV